MKMDVMKAYAEKRIVTDPTVQGSAKNPGIDTLYIHTYMHPYMHTYIHTCTHTYIHTYTHTYIQATTPTSIFSQ